MSRIGRRPIPLPNGVSLASSEDGTVTVKGPKGTLVRRLNPEITIREEGGNLLVERPSGYKAAPISAWSNAHSGGQYG